MTISLHFLVYLFLLNTAKNFPYGPHIKPLWFNTPVRVYDNPNHYRNLIGSDKQEKTIYYLSMD
jgi:hypothetical protein